MKMNNSKRVAEQYRDDRNLSIRIKLHTKYSTAQISLKDWLFSHYSFDQPCRILELGCGNAYQWVEHANQLSKDTWLVLSDLSDGMVEKTWAQCKEIRNVLVQKIDIQSIPFPDESFDTVIANHMLYHVPDIPKGLNEVRRILKPNGVFFAATNGNNGMHCYLHEKLKEMNPQVDVFQESPSFTLQNGRKILEEFFTEICVVEREDSLQVTQTQDLVDWIKSTISIADVEERDLNGLFEFFEQIRLKEGAINIPKEMGMFICRK